MLNPFSLVVFCLVVFIVQGVLIAGVLPQGFLYSNKQLFEPPPQPPGEPGEPTQEDIERIKSYYASYKINLTDEQAIEVWRKIHRPTSATIADQVMYFVNVVYWGLKSVFTTFIVIFQIIAIPFTLILYYPVLAIIEIPLAFLFIYGLVASIKILSSGMGGGD